MEIKYYIRNTYIFGENKVDILFSHLKTLLHTNFNVNRKNKKVSPQFATIFWEHINHNNFKIRPPIHMKLGGI